MSTTSGDGASEKPASHNPENKMDSEKSVGRNPHPDFEKVQASRPDWHSEATWSFTKTKKPDWKLGDGANDGGQSIMKQHVQIDPYEAGRPAVFNYKLLISAIVPRPIGFVGTISADGMVSSYLCLQTERKLRSLTCEQANPQTWLRFLTPR